jgi:hypothetical protein
MEMNVPATIEVITANHDVPSYTAQVSLNTSTALHFGFNSIDAADEWARLMAKKIEKQHKELMKHVAFVRN